MKSSILLGSGLSLILLLSCVFFKFTGEAFASPLQSSVRVAPKAGELVMHPVMDTKTGMVSGHIPLPGDWKVTAKGVFGPNGTEVKDFMGASLEYRPIYSIDQVIYADIVPNIQINQSRLLRVIDLPAVTRCDQFMQAQYWQAVPSENFNQVKGVEFEDASGKLGIIVVHFFSARSPYGTFNSYYMNVLTSQASYYEMAKQHYLYGIANFKQNPAAVAAHNRSEQEKSRRSWSEHYQRMDANQRSFEASQRTQETLSEVSDIYFEGWKERSKMNDEGHEKTINGIWERDAMINPYSGREIQVDAGYKYYYINQQGEYLGTDDAFYNPQQDPKLNHLEWRRLQKANN